MNRIAIAIPMYGAPHALWTMRWMAFQSVIAAYQENVSVYMSDVAYPDYAMTNLIGRFVEDVREGREDADYLLVVEQDMVLPENLFELVGSYTEPVVGALYFGRTPDDQRPIPGYLKADGNIERLTDPQVEKMLRRPGLHEVSYVGFGCTAIRRDVLEDWAEDRLPWFQRRDNYGHDVWFCREAARQGHKIYCDSRFQQLPNQLGHIGMWVSTATTYRAWKGHAGVPDGEKIPTAMTKAELGELRRLATGKTVLEVGSWYGASTVAMAKTAEKVYAVDWHQGDPQAGRGDTLSAFWTYLGAAVVRDKVVPLVGRTEDVLPRLQKQQYDLIFIDGYHDYLAVLRDTLMALPLLRPGGLLAFHDYGRERQEGYAEAGFGVTKVVDAFGEPAVTDTLAVVQPIKDP